MSEDNTDVAAVKRALAALADEGSIDWSGSIIAEAIESIEHVERAAAFADADGPDKLARAIEHASRADETDLTRRGQRALAAFQRFKRAADGANHFRSGHGMDLLEEDKRRHR